VKLLGQGSWGCPRGSRSWGGGLREAAAVPQRHLPPAASLQPRLGTSSGEQKRAGPGEQLSVAGEKDAGISP